MEEITRQFELAKLDYGRLATQEQALMNKRSDVWTKFFTILVVPSGYAGIVGIDGSLYVMALVPFFITCLSLEIKHDEKVLRYDVRKQMRNLAESWGFANHESKFRNQDGSRFWHGYYRYGKAAAFVAAEIIAAGVVSWYVAPTPLWSLGLLAVNAFFIVVTVWCMS